MCVCVCVRERESKRLCALYSIRLNQGDFGQKVSKSVGYILDFFVLSQTKNSHSFQS